jgi:hypothetical protein
MKRMFYILSALLCLGGVVHAQTALTDLYLKVQKKLSVDKKYLNVYYVTFQPTAADLKVLTGIPRVGNFSTVSFRLKENVSYQVYFLRDNFDLDSISLLTVKEIEDKAATNESFFGQTTNTNTVDTAVVLSFGDLQELYFANHPAYSLLFNRTSDLLKKDDPNTILAIAQSERGTKSRGITSPDNTDFLNYSRTNGFHRFPSAPGEQAKKVSARRRTADQSEAGGTDFQIDANLSTVGFFHNSMDLGFGSISAEINMGAKGINQVPWKTMAMNLGIRTLIDLPGTGAQNIRRDFILDAKIMGRMRVNTYSLVGKLPFVFGDKPLLNIGSGIVFDITGTRAYGLPFFNLYVATGNNSIDNPYAKLGTKDSSVAYFSSQQWEASWAFYWNTSEDRTVRFRMDIGAGNYNVYKATYTTSASKELVYNKIKPFVALAVNFAPQNVEFLGIGTKFADNVLSMNFWLKLLEISGQHTIRIETTYYTSPMFRSPYAWETPNGNSIVQLRYRYGIH